MSFCDSRKDSEGEQFWAATLSNIIGSPMRKEGKLDMEGMQGSGGVIHTLPPDDTTPPFPAPDDHVDGALVRLGALAGIHIVLLDYGLWDYM